MPAQTRVIHFYVCLGAAGGKECEVIMNEKPLDYSTLTKEQFDAEIEKGIADIKAGRVYSADEVEEEMKELMK